jgi:hypothetical protein
VTMSLARVVELVDTQDLKSCGHCGRAGSTPAPGTKPSHLRRLFSFKDTFEPRIKLC